MAELLKLEDINDNALIVHDIRAFPVQPENVRRVAFKKVVTVSGIGLVGYKVGDTVLVDLTSAHATKTYNYKTGQVVNVIWVIQVDENGKPFARLPLEFFTENDDLIATLQGEK